MTTPGAPAQPVAGTLTDEGEQYRRMFMAACADLGLINEALGLYPDDGGAEPILEAIAELKASAAPVAPEPAAVEPCQIKPATSPGYWRCVHAKGHEGKCNWTNYPPSKAAAVEPANVDKVAGVRAFLESTLRTNSRDLDDWRQDIEDAIRTLATMEDSK